MNEQTDIYVSAILDYELIDEKGDFRFDLGRTQLTHRAKPGLILDAGRLFYTDIAALVAANLFDGARASLDFPLAVGYLLPIILGS
ncbi:hypothetical protein MASR2M78_33270 [Treponema sp.]